MKISPILKHFGTQLMSYRNLYYPDWSNIYHGENCSKNFLAINNRLVLMKTVDYKYEKIRAEGRALQWLKIYS